MLDTSFPTASSPWEELVALGIVRETTGKQRGRVYAYLAFLALLDRGTEPLMP